MEGRSHPTARDEPAALRPRQLSPGPHRSPSGAARYRFLSAVTIVR